MFARFLPRAASRLASCAFRSQAGPRLGIGPCGWPLQAPRWAPLGLQPWQQPLRAPKMQTRLISNKIRIRFKMSKHRRLGLDIDSNGAKSVSFMLMLTILERS